MVKKLTSWIQYGGLNK